MLIGAGGGGGLLLLPSVDDERATYTLWGWTWTEATANPVYDSAGSYTITTPDIHGDTEGDDVWNYVQAYLRRTSGRNGYLERAQAWRNYYVNLFEGSAEKANDVSFLYDHFYGWGLSEYNRAFGDAGAAAEALTMCNELRNWWAAGGRSGGGSWPVAGTFTMATYGLRGPGRNLRTAVAIADATGNANAIELRDRLIDLWTQSPDWDATEGMYWVGSDATAAAQGPPISYVAGDRLVSSFHVGVLAEAFYTAWRSPTVTTARKTALRSKIIAMADYCLRFGLDPTYRYSSNYFGKFGAGGHWWNYSVLGEPVTSWDGFYTTSLVNLLVMAYKFTGTSNYLNGTPAVNNYPAKYCFNRGTKAIFGSTSAREVADNIAGHFVDTKFDTSTGSVYLYDNKGELQYTYLIFERGGVPSLVSELQAAADALAAGAWTTFNCNYPTDLDALITVANLDGQHHRCTEYADKMVWDSARKKIYYTGSGHASSMKTLIYDDLTNTWSSLGDPTWYTPTLGQATHGYQHNAFQGSTQYFMQFATNTTIRTRDVTGGNAWGTLNTTGVSTGSDGAIGSLEWFPTFGSGSLIVIDFAECFRWNGTVWSSLGSPSMGGYHNVGVYSPAKDLMYFGGGNGSGALYTLSNTGIVTAKTACPVEFGITASVCTVDPVNGKFLVFDGTQLRVFDPVANSWSIDATAVPAGFWKTDAQYGALPAFAILACPIPDYGVTLFITLSNGTPKIYLRKGRP